MAGVTVQKGPFLEGNNREHLVPPNHLNGGVERPAVEDQIMNKGTAPVASARLLPLRQGRSITPADFGPTTSSDVPFQAG